MLHLRLFRTLEFSQGNSHYGFWFSRCQRIWLFSRSVGQQYLPLENIEHSNCIVKLSIKMQVCCPSIKDNLPIPLKNILMYFNMTHFNKAKHHQQLSVFLFVLPLDIVNITILIIYSVLSYSVFPWRVSKKVTSYKMKFRESPGHKFSIEKSTITCVFDLFLLSLLLLIASYKEISAMKVSFYES